MPWVPMIYGQEPWGYLQRWLVNPVESNYNAIGFSLFGILFAAVLMLMRRNSCGGPCIQQSMRLRLVAGLLIISGSVCFGLDSKTPVAEVG